VRIVLLNSFLVRFDDAARDAQLWHAEQTGKRTPADLRPIAIASEALDIVERPRLLKRDRVPGLEWTVWARRWGDQAPLRRCWFDAAIDQHARDLVEEVLRTNREAAYEASLALELAGVLQRPALPALPAPPRSRRT